MPSETTKIIVDMAGWVIASLLAINVFFVRDFMSRIEKSLSRLTSSIDEHATKLNNVDKNVSERLTRLDVQIAEINRARKNGKVGEHIWHKWSGFKEKIDKKAKARKIVLDALPGLIKSAIVEKEICT